MNANCTSTGGASSSMRNKLIYEHLLMAISSCTNGYTLKKGHISSAVAGCWLFQETDRIEGISH